VKEKASSHGKNPKMSTEGAHPMLLPGFVPPKSGGMESHMKKDLIVFIDSGDTIVDESTEIKDEYGTVLQAGMIEGAGETLAKLYESGYTIALVADGTRTSFDNIYKQNGLDYCFSAKAISGDLGKEKPSDIMFLHAMKELGLGESDKKRIVMIGNNLKRDIVGANNMGITSILISYSPRYVMQPENIQETPDYVVATPSELIGLLDQLDLQIKNRQILGGA
jgi:putative hydrolase of the HAD superfamily